MSLTINTNLEAMDAQRNPNNTQMKLSQSMERLSSGLRINSAADDVAGYAISQRLQSQVNGLNQAAQNSQDAISLAQTAQGSLNDVKQLVSEMERIGETTKFNGVSLLSEEATISFQVGANDAEVIAVKTLDLKTAIEGKIELGGEESIKGIEEAISKVTAAAGEMGAVQDRIQYTEANLEVYAQNLSSAVSGISDVNMAVEMTAFTKAQVLQQAGVAILTQANHMPQAALKLIEGG